MSRHRFVRNIDINEELEEDPASDGGYDDLSPEDHERLVNGLEYVRRILGDEQTSKLSDTDITDALYHYYFDVDRTTAWLLEEQERKLAAQARKDVWQPEDGKPLPMPPYDDYADWSPPPDNASGRHNVPFVRLTSSEYVSSSEQETTRASTRPGSLYTITEMTERTEDSRDWGPVHHPPPFLQAAHGDSHTTLLSTTTSSYGQVIERPPLLIDPNEIPPSPSSSALRRLSLEGIGSPTGPPQINYSDPSDTDSSRPPTVIDLPPIDNIPDIPDYVSKSSMQPPQGQGPSQASLLTRSVKPSDDTKTERSVSAKSGRSEKSEKKSKLSALASSRSSVRSSVKYSASSVSSRSSATETEVATTATYSALRPAAASFVSLLPPARPLSTVQSESSESTTPSSLTRNVEQAIQSALALEALERRVPQAPSVTQSSTAPPSPPPKSLPSIQNRPPSDASTPKASPIPFPRKASTETSSTSSATPRSPPADPASLRTVPRPPPSSPPRTQIAPSTYPQPRQLSKLAKLAQAKAQEQGKSKSQSPSLQPGLILPRSHTEYLTPTANGPTATTAITTTYQSLSGLLSQNQLKLPHLVTQPLPSGPIPKLSSATSQKQTEQKQSKLAMKSKSARLKTSREPEPEPEPESAPVLEVPMFSQGTIRSRAQPSAFASLLVSDEPGPDVASTHGSGGAEGGTYLCQHHKAERAKTLYKSRDGSGRPRVPRHTQRFEPILPSPPPSLRGFAFDVPSPDDVVFNARKGTLLGQRSTSSTHSALSAAAR